MTPEPPIDATDDQVVVLDLDRLAGLHDRPSPRRTDRLQQRGPRAEVRPADVHRRHRDLAVARGALHHRVVDRDGRWIAS